MPVEIEVGAPFGQAKTVRGLSPALRGTTIKVVKRTFEPDDVRSKDGLRLARPALALIELAAQAPDRTLRFAFLEACRLELFRARDLECCFERFVHLRGIGKLRPYLVLWVPELNRIRSVLEGWFLLVWVRRGYPMPRVNEKVGGYEVDFHWPARRFVLETDGDAFHRHSPQKLIDQAKQRSLEASGLTVTRLTFKEFEADPEGKVDEVAHRLGYL
jgi:hypothetical protein